MRTPTSIAAFLLAASAVAAAPSALGDDGTGPAGAVDPQPSITRAAVPSTEDPVASGTTERTGGLFCVRDCCPTLAEMTPCYSSFFDAYVPVVPVGPSRSAFTTMVMPATPWLLTQGEASTPLCGRVGFNLSRISDERMFTDDVGNRYESDGEVQVAVLEGVSPVIWSDVGGCCIPFHVAGSLSAYSLNYAWFDHFRNFVEENLFNADQSVIDSHTLRGRELSITDPGGDRHNLLDSTPMWKFEGVIKFPLPDVPVCSHALTGSLSVGIAPPAFGNHDESGNRTIQGDVTLAMALPFSEHFRLTGAANLAVPGESKALDRRGVDHHDLVGGGILGLEWWPTQRFAVSLGGTVNGPYTRDSGLSTDLASYYVNFGLLYRVSSRLEFHALFSENPGGKIAVNGTPSSDYSFDTQRDADFSVTFGGTFDF